MDEYDSGPSPANDAEINSENKPAGEDQFFPKIHSLKMSQRNEENDSSRAWPIVAK